MDIKSAVKVPGSKVKHLDRGIVKARGGQKCYAVRTSDAALFLNGKFIESGDSINCGSAATFYDTLKSVEAMGLEITEFTYYLIK